MSNSVEATNENIIPIKIEVNENGLRKYSKKNPPKSRGKGKCNQPGTLYDETAFYIKR